MPPTSVESSRSSLIHSMSVRSLILSGSRARKSGALSEASALSSYSSGVG